MSSFFEYAHRHEAFFKKHGELLWLKKGQYLVWRAERYSWMYFLAEGSLRVSFTLPDGTLRVISYFLPGMSFAQAGSFWSEGSEIEFVADEPAAIYRVKLQDFFAETERDPAFGLEYMHMLRRNQLYLLDRLIYQGEKDVRSRCIRWLLSMAKFYGDTRGNACEIEVPLTQTIIAGFLFTTRESANAALAELTRKKLVRLKQKRLTILNLEKLQQLFR